MKDYWCGFKQGWLEFWEAAYNVFRSYQYSLNENYEIRIEPDRGPERRLYIMTDKGMIEHKWNNDKKCYEAINE